MVADSNSLQKTILLIAVVGSVLPAFSQTVGLAELNYIDGSVSVDNEPISKTQVPMALKSGESLDSSSARAEVLLTPGSFLRLRQGTTVTFTDMTAQSVSLILTKGEALVDVTQLGKDRIDISLAGQIALPLAPGLYDFDADRRELRVYDGKALIADSRLEVRKGYAAVLDASGIRLQRFDANLGDSLYVWGALASEYEAAASYGIVLGLPRTSSSDGWYLNPQMHCWAFVPRNGIVNDPFGWAFAAPSDLSNALILTGPVFHYPAAADRRNLPRDFAQFGNSLNVEITQAKRLAPPSPRPWAGFGPGKPSAPIFVPH